MPMDDRTKATPGPLALVDAHQEYDRIRKAVAA